MTTYRWQDTREHATRHLKTPPSGQLEQDIIDHFQKDPQRVINEIEIVAAQLKAGADIRSPWAVLRKRLSDATNTEDVVVTDRQRQHDVVRHARQFITNTGAYLSEAQLLEEFTDRGITNPDDVDGLTAYWREHRTALTNRARAELAAPPETRELPDWVRRWKAARAVDDYRLFPEQESGILELHEASLLEGHTRSGYDREILLLAAPKDDASVFVQPWEYVHQGNDAIDDDPEPGTPEWHARQAAAA